MTSPQLAQAFQLYAQGKLQEAKALTSDLLTANPGDVEAQYLLGGIAFALERPDEAEHCFRAVLDAGFQTAELFLNLAEALQAQGKNDEAIAFFERTLAQDPKMTQAHQRLGLLLAQTGRYGEAADMLQKAFFQTPDASTANNLGAVLQKAERLAEAEAWYRQSLNIDPMHAKAQDNLGGLMQLEGRLSDAIECHEQAIAIDPSFASARVNLASAFMAEGRIKAAVAALRWAQVMEKNERAASQNFLMCLNYDETTDLDGLYLEHRRWGDYQEKRITVLPGVAKLGGKLPRPLRLGLVSADFKRHSVAYFLEPLLEALNREEVQLYLYADVANQDEVTQRLKGCAHVWRDLMGMSDEQAAKLVRDDGVHILIDLSGHTAGNRLPMFVLKPAPVQASWLGYPATTGLSRIDWRITDALADPQDGMSTERPMRLPGFLCYRPDESAPQPSVSPALDNGFVTFGSFNALAKLTERDLSLIGRILKQVPQSRFLLKARPLADEGVKKRLCQRLDHHGIDPLRVELLGRVSETGGHLALYARIDIALDPVHYNGTATSCEALWMGVPLVTLAGTRHAQRVGASILTRANLAHLIAKDDDAYVALAAKLASDIPALATARQTQRQTVAASPLMDKQAFAADFTQALAKMWEGA
ncbi:TPR repeat-containing protein [Rhodospirillaceae bacterium LM-1]|nr:TPR repeat-containing protein [Rhodospirillaceae bacterium LM-1]